MSFFDELKRRNVFRVGIAFAITAWLIAQIASLAVDSFGAPDWVMKMIITMLILGSPVALVMAWAYELTPDGLRRESDIAPGQSSTQANASKLDRTITIALVLAVAYFSYDKFVLDPRRDTDLLESASQQLAESNLQVDIAADESSSVDQTPSIAVLPFVNMSDDASNEYFSEGLSEELLNLLVRIPELKVAARTSSFSYKGKDTRIAQIGAELGVSHVLEGSVRKAGNRLRITAQLIKADDGYHLWSQTYDRTLDDIFATQDEIAAAVVAALKVSLLGVVPEGRKTDPEVYSLYLHGKYFITPPKGSREELEKSVSAFKKALAMDPDYAPAWLGLSWAYELQARSRVLPRAQTVQLAREAAERALAIDDKLALAWSTSAYLKKKYEWDWQGAKVGMDKALQLEPNNVDVLLGVASVTFALGQIDLSIELLERVVTLDPLRLEGLASLAHRYRVRGRYEEALKKYRQVLALYPENIWAPLNIIELYVHQGNPERALAEINKIPVDTRVSFIKAKILFALGEEAESRELTSDFLNTPAQEHSFQKALIYAWRGENDAAFESLELAFEQHHSGLTNILLNEDLARLASDPRYQVFLEKLGLLEFWKAMPSEYVSAFDSN